MNRKRMTFLLALGAIVLLVVVFMLRGVLRTPQRIVLPDENTPGAESGEGTSDAIARIEVTPETVQSVVATLHRPARTHRSVSEERFFEGGSGTMTAEIWTDGTWQRIDARTGGETRHTITDGANTYIWYGSSRSVYTAPALFSADEEAGIPTYEDLLAYDPAQIIAAEYLPDAQSIHVTARDGEYTETYDVSVANGLLVAAEKTCGETLCYRMTATELAEVSETPFVLPDGTVLHELKAVQ